jgi:hypothetical protein
MIFSRKTLQSPHILSTLGGLLILFVVISSIYLLLLTKNYYWDGIFFAQTIEAAPRLNPALFHPNHLFYNVLGYLGYRLAHGTGLSVRALTILQVLNCFASAATACLLCRLLFDVFKSAYVSVTLTAIFAFSATWWKFSTDADSYILSVFFLVLSFCLVLPGRKARPLALAFAHAGAMFFHELAVFFFPVAIVGLAMQSRGDAKRTARLITYSLTVFLITAGTFYCAFYLTTGSLALRPFVRWITTFSPEHGFTFHPWDNFVYSMRSQWRVFFGGRLSFVRDLWGLPIIILCAISLALVVIFFFTLIRYLRELKPDFSGLLKRGSGYNSLRILCCLWIAVYVIFLFFFIPQNTFYRLFYLPPLIVLAGTFLSPIDSAETHIRRYRTALFAAIVFAVNLTISAYPYAQVRANPPLGLAQKLHANWKEGTVVYFASPNSDNGLVRYFNPSIVWIETTPEMMTQKGAGPSSGGRDAWLDTTLIDRFQATPEGRLWLDTHTIRRPEYELVNRKFNLKFYQLK